MPTDLQLIDGFEQLRERFAADNPASLLEPPRPPPAASAQNQVAEAWIQAMEGRTASDGAARRRVRSLARVILSQEPEREETDALPPADRRMIELGRRLPDRLELAAGRRLWPIVAEPPERSLAEEAAAWGALLPGLSGLRPWRLLALLGRPAVVPQAHVRRFLWRLGLLELNDSTSTALRQTASLVERIAGLTGLAAPGLAVLIDWHAGVDRKLAGGSWCGQHPQCPACPLRPGCGWARYQPAGAEEDGRAAPGARLEALRVKIADGRQDQLEEIELLALLLQGGAAKIGAMELAEQLLQRFGGLAGLERAPLAELLETRGISRARATRLKVALEIGRRRAAQAHKTGDTISCSEDIWTAYRGRYTHLPQEHFVVVLLDVKNRIIHEHVVSKGTLTGSLVHPREVFTQAVRHSAAGVIVLHNHPSGDPTPSPEDHSVTARLQEAGEILGIRVLDHIILGADDYYSFKDEE